MSTTEKAKEAEEERTISASKPKVRKVESDEDDSDFECYTKSGGKPVHVHIDKEVTEGGQALVVLPNNSEEEEIINNGETMGEYCNTSVRRSNRIFESPDRLGSEPFFRKYYSMFDIIRTNPKRTTKAQIDKNGGDRLGQRLRSE